MTAHSFESDALEYLEEIVSRFRDKIANAALEFAAYRGRDTANRKDIFDAAGLIAESEATYIGEELE